MIIECIGGPFTYRWPTGEVRLEPGKPVDLPEARAQRLLNKAPGKVRVVTPSIAAGSLFTWTRGDGSKQEGFVDFLYADHTENRWAIVSLPGGTWAFVNVKFLKEVNP